MLHAVQLPDRIVRELQRLDDARLLHLPRSGLHHDDVRVGGRDDQVEVRLVQLGERRIQDEVAVHHPDPDGRDRLGKRMSETMRAAEAPVTPRMSESFCWSEERTVHMIWISLR